MSEQGHINIIALATIVTKEVRRFMRIWPQTLLPSAITTLLYLLIFGQLIGQRIGPMDGISYIDYIVPGIIMLSVINNAYGNVSSSFYGTKFQRQIEEMLVAPVPNWVLLSGYCLGGVVRGCLSGVIVALVASGFSSFAIHSPWLVVAVIVLTATLFSVAGLINALFANSFDAIAIVPTFILTPLTYLGGIFYSISLLPPFWQKMSLVNPMLYMVNAFRYGMLGSSDIPVDYALSLLLAATILLVAIALFLLHRGTGLKP